MTTVTNIKHQKTWRQDGVEYIGCGSIFGNPFKIETGRTRDESIAQYKKYLYEKLERDNGYKKMLLTLKDKTLGCYCRPKDGFQGQLLCHGQIIAGYLDNIKPEDVK